MICQISIVGGCGHVGLPLGLAFTLAGAKVTLIDTDPARREAVANGRMPFHERGGDAALTEALQTGRLEVAAGLEAVTPTEYVIITIGTPVDEFLDPAVRRFDRAIERIIAYLRPGQLMVLRSTVFPMVTARLARSLEDRGLDVDVAFCPERIAQGYALEEIRRLPQIIGGTTPRATQRARALFRLLGAETLELSPAEAELAKLFCNSYRYINFAIANQFYMIAQRFGADFAKVHHAVTKDYPRMAHFAQAGFAGGPCLLKDTMQLSAFNHNSFVLGQAAMMINEGLPHALVEQAKKRYPLAEMKAAILGMAFKGDCDDPRDSLAYKLRKVLQLECRDVLCTDPYIEDPSFVPLAQALREADVFFVGACHQEYRHLAIAKPVIDVFNFLAASPAAQRRAA